LETKNDDDATATAETTVLRLIQGNGSFDREELLDALAQLSPAIYGQYRDRAVLRLSSDEKALPLALLDREVSQRSAARLRDSATAASDSTARVLASWKVEPYEEAVGTSMLLDELLTIISQFAILPKEAAIAVALWILHAWTFEAADWLPILAVTSPDRRCGKTRLLEIVLALAPRVLPTSNMSASVYFRMVDRYMPTTCIDEGDAFLGDQESLRGIMNAGRSRATAFVWRTAGGEHEPRAFSVFAPISIALIGSLPSTLEDRSIEIRMRRKRTSEKVPHLRSGQAQFAMLRRKAARWAADHRMRLDGADPRLPDELDDRAQDNWRPLVAIADLAGGEWPDRARGSAAALSGDRVRESISIGESLLGDLRALFTKLGDKLASKTICEQLAEMEDRPWPEFGKAKKPITQTGLASLLKPFEIRPKTIWLAKDVTAKGYVRADFEDAFARYLPPVAAQRTGLQPSARQDAPERWARGLYANVRCVLT